MSHRSSPEQGEETQAVGEADALVLRDLLGWGQLLSTLVQVLDPFYQLDDLLQTDHPLKASEKPLGALVRHFGRGTEGAPFLFWWTGEDSSLPVFQSVGEIDNLLPLGLAHRWRASELQISAERCFLAFDQEWLIERDRLRHCDSGEEAIFSKSLGEDVWDHVVRLLPGRVRQQGRSSAARVDDAIDRVRSFFAPIDSPFFGMDDDLLAHHVSETIPREGPKEDLTPIVPLFGKGHLQKAFPSTAQLPAHLRVILQRLIRSQDNNDLVTSLLSTLEAVDFSLRFATSLGQGSLAVLTESDFPGDFNPTTQQLIADLVDVLEALPKYWDEPVAQAPLNLMFQGQTMHPFLRWGGFDGVPRLLSWMIEAEDTIRQDNPARSAVLLSEMMDVFNDWIAELTLLCSSWDLVTHARQDGYLQISLARGDVWLSCKPLIDPTRYSVWLDRSELTLVNSGGALDESRDSADRLAPLDRRIQVTDIDPPFLAEQLGNLVRAHDQGQILALGRALFFGLEYLVRLHASLAGGFLRHCFEETSILDPVLKEGGSLEHTIYFLSYSQRIIGRTDRTEAHLLHRVFFDGNKTRDFSHWLGLGGGVPGPLQGLLGWSLSLMRPDAKTRLNEVRGQVQRLSGFFADFLDESRRLWREASLKTDTNGDDDAEAVVLSFPTGLSLRGIPDVMVGPRMERGRRGVVVGSDSLSQEFSDWEGEDFRIMGVQSPQEEPEPEAEDVPEWPSFFEDSESSSEELWGQESMDAISRICQARSFSGPDARPRQVAEEISKVVARKAQDAASVLICQGEVGTGKTFLCRTLTNPACSPLPEDYPVLYLKVDRFPQTRLATVVERLNDHIASEESLERFEWDSVPLESLKALGTEVARLTDELSALGLSSENLGNRLASYLRHLKKVNGDRSFLLILDGFAEVPRSIIPSALPPGVHLLITGLSFPDLDFPSNPFMEYAKWDLSGPQTKETFGRQLQGLQLNDEEKARAREKFQSSLFVARAYRDLRELDESYPATTNVLNDLFSMVRAKFTEPEKFRTFLRLLSVLGLYERPIPLPKLQSKIQDADVVRRSLEMFPSLFEFWDEPHPCLGLAHRAVLDKVREVSEEVESVADELATGFLDNPRRTELLPALRWFDIATQTDPLMERFFTESAPLELWREELASLQENRLFFQRVALLDAVAAPLESAVQAGAGDLREELAWVHNSRGLSLLELGLVDEAVADFEKAVEIFSGQFDAGDFSVLHAIASAHSRMSEAALKSGDVTGALERSLKALGLLHEKSLSSEDDESLAELRCRVLLQAARGHLAAESYDEVLDSLSRALPDLERLEEARAKTLRGECFLVAGRALAARGADDEALEQLDAALGHLMAGATAELGLQALILRGRVYQKMGKQDQAERDLGRALSILRYHVAVGRLDLEPLLAYTAAQASSVGPGGLGHANNLGEFIDWARGRIRYEGRSDLRGLLAFLLLTRGARWKDLGYFAKAASDLRSATEQYDLLSREVSGAKDEPVWVALRQSFRNLTALYLSLDEPHLALICGRRALELGRRQGKEFDSAEESLELPNHGFGPLAEEEPTQSLTEVRLYQLGKLYFHLGEAARRVGLSEYGSTYFERSARAFAQACGAYEVAPPRLVSEYSLVLKMAAQAAFEDSNGHALEIWVEELGGLPDQYLTQFDNYRFWRWLGHTQQSRAQFEQATDSFERAFSTLEKLKEHPRWRSLEAEILLDLGRVHSLNGQHDEALKRLDQAAHKAHDALFAEGEENRDLLVLCALHSAVAHLRSQRTTVALDQLRILVSLRPGQELHEVEALAQDWVQAWAKIEAPKGMELLKSLGQLSELGDWLLRTTLGTWYREVAASLINDPQFESMIMSSSRIDRILETYLILTFSQVEQDTRPESNPELDRLLAAKFRAFDSENRDLEAELLMGHLLPIRLNPESGNLLLRRSEMALLRGDRGLAIIDLLRAIDGGGDCRLRAHLRLAEFLQSRGLEAASVHHLRRALQATDARTEGLSSLCGRCCRLLTRLSKAGVRLDLSFYREHFRVLLALDAEQLKPNLDLAWLRPVREQQEWSELFELSLGVLAKWQKAGHDKPSDWAFLDEVLDRTVLCQGRLPLALLEKFGQLLTSALSTFDVQNRMRASSLWERFATFLPGLGKRNALELLQRLFEFALRTESASKEGHAEEFLRRLEEEKRILVQPR